MSQPALPGLAPTPPPLTRNQQHPTGGQLPAWITDQLDEDRRSPGATTARFHRCHRCKEIVLTGLDATVLAMTATADPTPLTPTTEKAMIMMERETYHARPAADGYRLVWRFPANQPDRPAVGAVIPAHHCGRRLPGFIHPPITDTDPDNDPDALPF